MKNAYAKDYYDSFLKQLPDDYKTARWFSSPPAKLDYKQTRRSLEAALGPATFTSILEIGPGDGVWTDLIIGKAEKITLLDQSIEMLKRAQDRLKEHSHISYEQTDFLAFNSTQSSDLIFAIRCFEYFEDKDAAVAKFATLLVPGGKLILVTKNPDHIKMNKVQERELHSGQITKADLVSLLKEHNFIVEPVISATWRFKAKYALSRALFDLLQALHVMTKGVFMLPFLTTPLTESYLYVATKK